MSTLSDRLQALGVKIGGKNLPKLERKDKDAFPISSVLPGEWWQTPNGDAFVVETKYKQDFLVGQVKLSPMGPLDIIAAWAKEPSIKDYTPDQFVFIDTETTGLAGGTGTYTFLIGAGRFEGEHFRLAQFFLTDPGQEAAQLAAFESFIVPGKVLVSFNGKAFDIPLINTRYTLNGWPSPVEKTPHIDLLHLARRLWKSRLPSRALGDLEWHILGAKRSDQDVPGWMIADLFFDYLHTGDARPLRGIFYHNEIDVLSLVGLLNHISFMVSDPFHIQIEYGQDRLAVGKLYADLGYINEAALIYQRTLESECLQPEQHWEAVCQLSFLYKKLGNMEAAKTLWTQAAENKQLYAIEELAKLCEHTERDFLTALRWTEDALALINTGNTPDDIQSRWKKSLLHRRRRLQRRSKFQREK